MRLAVIGDIHGNAMALSEAIKRTDAQGFDYRIFLGDLLTYGVEVGPVLEQMSRLEGRSDHVLLLGNHDALYRDLFIGHSSYFEGLHDWVQEAASWTFERLAAHETTWKSLTFHPFFDCEKLWFSHANTFGNEDWRYLNSTDDHQVAAQWLTARKYRAGCFGHTHRIKLFQRDRFLRLPIKQAQVLGNEALIADCLVINAGSIGQPRDRANGEHVLWLSSDSNGLSVQFDPLDFDIDHHRRAIGQSDLPAKVKNRILAFHAPR